MVERSDIRTVDETVAYLAEPTADYLAGDWAHYSADCLDIEMVAMMVVY